MKPSIPACIARALAALTLVLAATGAAAQEDKLRKTLAERLPDLPKIDEVTKTGIPGLYEVRIGTEVLYADERGDFVIQGHIIDTRTREDLTEARLTRLTAIDFAALPLKDAIVLKQGSGTRRMAVFVDPNCGYCKRFERDLVELDNVTIYTFLYPILGADSTAKARDIWCAADPGKTWRAWMLDGVKPPKSIGNCDASVLERNQALGRKHRVNGTPALVFQDGTRKSGAIPGAQVEKMLATAAVPKS